MMQKVVKITEQSSKIRDQGEKHQTRVAREKENKNKRRKKVVHKSWAARAKNGINRYGAACCDISHYRDKLGHVILCFALSSWLPDWNVFQILALQSRHICQIINAIFCENSILKQQLKEIHPLSVPAGMDLRGGTPGAPPPIQKNPNSFNCRYRDMPGVFFL